MLHGAQCGKVRGWMADAASGSLSESRRGEFEAHIGDCAACGAEFQRTEKLLGKIDQNLRATLAVEPSPQLLANVRQSVAAERQCSRQWLTSSVWVTAGASAALAAVLIGVGVHRANQPTGGSASHHAVANSAPAHVPAVITRSTSAENAPPRAPAHARLSKPRLAVARQELLVNAHRDSEPEVIVQPGQMQAILQFVAASQKGQFNAAKIFDDKRQDVRPIVIRPLAIAPLKIAALDESLAQDSARGSAREGARR